MAPSPLFAILAREIREDGPIPLDRYMALCLGHPVHGYYRTRDPLGAAGDFVTAPEISQIFGELIGIWAAATWSAMGVPEPLRLVELGPGRGTLMSDALRALGSVAKDVRVEPHLVETSPILRAAQRARLAGQAAIWHEDATSVPEGPAIVIANEFFDALPVRQFERRETGWHERRVGLGSDGTTLRIGLDPDPDPRLEQDAPVGSVLTLPGAALELIRTLASRIARAGGALLAIDYGHVRPGFGDSLQAVCGHRSVDPLEAPGEADLTTHVDFHALARAAAESGAAIHGPVDQRDFLAAMGLDLRAGRLKAHATPAQAVAIGAGVARLTDPGRRGMGALFKALAVSHPSLSVLPGFPPAG